MARAAPCHRIAMALPVFDGHNDVLLAERSFADASEEGELDLARARAGAFAGGFFAIFAPHPDGYERKDRGPDTEPEPPVEHGYALDCTWAGVRKLLDLERANALVPSSRNLTDAQLDAVRDTGGVVGICFHREDCGPRREDIACHVHYVAERIGPAHVALGSDFDGAEMPDGMRGAQDLPLVL